MADKSAVKSVDYDALATEFNEALLKTLRQHGSAETFLDFWVPEADPVRGIAGMVDSARMGGLPAIEISFKQTTVPAERFPELTEILRDICTSAIDVRGDTVVLRVTDLKAGAKPAATEAAPGAVSPLRAEPHNFASSSLQPSAAAASSGAPKYDEVQPYFQSALEKVIDKISREGTLEQNDPKLIYVSGAEGPVSLFLSVDPTTNKIAAARHTGGRSDIERAALDVFCRLAEKLPVQEATDHAGLRVLTYLIDDDKPAPVRGVLLPCNAGAVFMLAPRLSRQAFDDYRARVGAKEDVNFYYRPAPPEWQRMTSDERVEKVDYVLRGFLQSEGLYPDDVILIRIQKNKYGDEVRVNIGFSTRIAASAKPDIMRRAEKRLRRDLNTDIDLVADRARDTSPLRRLSGS